MINYFNYYTEIEEHFQRARGTCLFLLSSLDWALVESWKNSDVPLEAVLRGIDTAFEKWRSRRIKTQQVNSLAFCAQAVLTEAAVMSGAAPARTQRDAAPPFPIADLRGYLEHNVAEVKAVGQEEIGQSLERILADLDRHYADLEDLERLLTVLEEKMIASARGAQTEQQLLDSRRELDAQLRPYRGKMSAGQIALLEKQYLERILLEKARLPRLSLFYLR